MTSLLPARVLFAQPGSFPGQVIASERGAAMPWIVGFALLGLILALLLAPAFEVRLTRRITSAVLTSGFFLTSSLVLNSFLGYFGGDREPLLFVGLLAAFTAGLGLFFLLMASVRFALAQSEQVPPERTPPN